MRNTTFGLVFLAFAVLISPVGGRDENPKEAKDAKEPKQLMQRKLKHSQKILEGVALGDFGMIAKNADELIVIAKTAEWKALKTPKYELYSNDFKRDVETLVEKAKDKNLDGAVLAYLDLTLTCVRCHKHVREIRDARLSPKLDDKEGVASAHGHGSTGSNHGAGKERSTP